MIAGSYFHLYVGQFTAGEVASMCGVSRPVIDTWGTRGFLQPTRRERQSPSRVGAKTKSTDLKKGKPLFSAADAFKAQLLKLLSEDVGTPLEIGAASEVAGAAAYKGEWMWAVARGVEKEKPLLVYTYVARVKSKWQFDMHIGERGKAPCFGWSKPHIYVPMSDIFTGIYLACKRLVPEWSEHPTA